MTTNSDVTRIILSQAEKQIVHLKDQIEENVKSFSQMSENEIALEKQIILLNAQINNLEGLLKGSIDQLSDTGHKISKVHDAVAQMKTTSLAALKQVNANSSKAQMAVTLCELAIRTKMTNEVQFLEDAQRQIEELRTRLKPK